MADSTCPSRNDLTAFLIGRLAEDTSDAIAHHVDSCAACQAMLDTLGGVNDTLAARLHGLGVEEEFADEPECREVMAALEASALELHASRAAPRRETAAEEV